ncbi:MAG: hypothetical protein AAF658_18600, partial [Myxococcota bacterium]
QAAGTLGGLDGADALCAERATAAGLPGNYVALLSNATTDAIDRIGAARGWVRPDGLPFLLDGPFEAPLYLPRLDETGTEIPGSLALLLTATDRDGMYDGQDCGDFQVLSNSLVRGGYIDHGGVAWFNFLTTTCSVTATRLLCMQTDSQKTLQAPVPPAPFRYAFAREDQYVPGPGGVSAADALCQMEAESLGVATGRTYIAMLGTSTASALSRFDLSGPNWYSLDGVPLVSTPADIANGRWNTAIGTQNFGTATGGPFDATVALTDNCENWTEEDGTHLAGRSLAGGEQVYQQSTRAGCSNSFKALLCFEE